MHFNRLRLNGFKSFVDPTDLVIAEGLTGVVGPNGCGKSNLLEALRWVMGETRPTAMRGGGMEDVIFAGAARRPARNFAEVSLVLDNSERRAPAAFNTSDTLDITRRITRDAGSAYKVNGRDARARDVHMLFADASTGAHSPALVRQGQISELINAKPAARRRVLEEAAGIAGLYQRRHEAELRLNAAETNLSRVDDVLEQLAGQLAQLARQARQAARYREISEALRHAEGQLLWRRWAEAEATRASAAAALGEASKAAARAQTAASAAERTRIACEEALPALREEETIAAALVQRARTERDQIAERRAQAEAEIARLRDRLAQLARDAAREEALDSDAGESIASLAAERASLAAEQEGHGAALARAAEAARAAAALLQERESAFETLAQDTARLAARHQSAERARNEAAQTLTRAEAEAQKARASAAAADEAEARAAEALTAATQAQQEAEAGAAHAEAALVAADQARSEAQSREAEARARHAEAAGEAGALRAELAALARLVQRDTAEGGQIIDALKVAPGHEKALGAALADDLRAPELVPGAASGWASLPDYPQPQPLPAGVAPLAAHVSGPPVLARRLSQIGLVERAAGAGLQAALAPGQRLVSLEGDLWRWDGFRAGAEDAPTAAALRLQQLNRLTDLKRDLEEATARADGTAQAHAALKADLARLSEADAAARAARRAADQRLAEAGRALSQAEGARALASGRGEALRAALARHEEEASAARLRLAEAETAAAGLEDITAARAAHEAARTALEAARLTMLARRSAHDELRRDGEARTARIGRIGDEIESWESRLASARSRLADLAARRATAEAALAQAEATPATLEAAAEKSAQVLAQGEARLTAAIDARSAAEAQTRRAAETERAAAQAAATAREARAAAEARAEAATEAVAATARAILEAREAGPEALLEALACTAADIPPAAALEGEITRLTRQRDGLGAVNLRAEEDAREVAAERDGLAAEKADLEEAIKVLRGGIASLNREGRERLLTAFEQVNANFRMLFTHLFGGGEARLVMIDSDDPLDAGLEIMCQPPGKKLATLSLLSGGEQTLTALALIFAVFLTNPAPICVLDEVDAPLDDANVGRFCDMLDEMTRRTETRFLIITHHAVTMARMDRLFGVTMAEQGVSQLVSVDLGKAAALVA